MEKMIRLAPNMHTTLTPNVIQALNKNKIFTVLDFIGTDRKTIEKVSKLSFREIIDSQKALLKQFAPTPKNALERYQSIVSDGAIFETGMKRLDILLGGGLFTGNIYEVCGLPASGKTLFCLSLLKHLVPKMRDHNVYYLDTKQDPCWTKLKQMLSHLSKEDIVETMCRIFVQRVGTLQELLNSLYHIKEKLKEGSIIRVIIIDSLAVPCMLTSDITEMNALLNYTGNILNYLVNQYNIVVVVTNLVTLWNEGDFSNTNVLKERVSGGTYWYNVPHTRIKFARSGNKISVILLKTTKIMPVDRTCQIEFNENGILS